MTKLSDYIPQNQGSIPAGGTTSQVLGKISDNDFDVGWQDPTSGGGGIPEAPINGSPYGRRNAAWVIVLNQSVADTLYAPISHTHSQYLTDASSTGSPYGRLNGTWQVVLNQASGDARYSQLGHTHAQYLTDAPSDSKTYGRNNGAWVEVTGGSGGDASTLGGVPPSGYLRSDVADDKTAGDLRFLDNVKLSLGTGNDCQFYVNGVHAYIDLNSGIGNLYIRDGTATRFTFDDNGTFTSTGDITAFSDERLKENVQPIYNALGRVRSLEGVTFNRIDQPNQRRTGLIAQNVQIHMPEAVSNIDGYLSVAYGNLVGLLVEAIKELEDRVDAITQ